MRLMKNSLTVLLLSALLFFLSGCALFTAQEESQAVIAPAESEDNIPYVAVAEKEEVVVPADKSDRLPGSLKWDSIALYASGFDFLKDLPDGLHTEGARISSTEDTTTSGQTATDPEPGTVYVTTVDDLEDLDFPTVQPPAEQPPQDGDWWELD